MIRRCVMAARVHKKDLTVTGAIGVDAESQIVTTVDVLHGNTHDSSDAEELTKDTENSTDSQVETAIGDGAYQTVEQRIKAEEAGPGSRAACSQRT